MFKTFLSNNRNSILFIGVLVVGWLVLFVFNADETEKYLHQPQKGDVYIFRENEIYAPMRLDSIGETTLYMRNYLFMFSDALPAQKQIIENEFDLEFYAIYERQEVKKLYKEERLVKIYRYN